MRYLFYTVSVAAAVTAVVLFSRQYYKTSTPSTSYPIQASPAPRSHDKIETTQATPLQKSPICFTDSSHQLDSSFVSFSGMTHEKLFPTANGSGVAMLDYDRDGWMDLYFACSSYPDRPDVSSPPNALCRSQFGAAYERAPDQAGAAITGFTQGVASADHNNDGFPDLYLVRLGSDILLQNMGDGTFADASGSFGTDARWGTSAAFLDYDEDGNLDLYVANYGKWDMEWHKQHYCGQAAPPVRIYCSPKILPAEVHNLYRSNGDGTFADVASNLGIARSDGRGQGVVAADVNNDGHIDLYVANDLSPNFLFLNQGKGQFIDATDTSCAAYNADGQVEASMGVDAEDIDGDKLADLVVTNFFLEHNTLYRNLDAGLFQDVSHWSGVAAGSIQLVGWGTALEDLDEDGWCDLFVVNGHVDDNLAQMGRDEPYAQPSRVWRNHGRGQFQKMEGDLGDYFRTAHVSRGAAFGDLDNDGDVDIAITHKDERPTILRNDSRSRRPAEPYGWIQLSLQGTLSNRDAVGASIEVHSTDRVISRQIRGGRSYLSAHDLRVCVGLGQSKTVQRVIVRWPSGLTTELENPSACRTHTVREPQSK
jgi:hypothetical protein